MVALAIAGQERWRASDLELGVGSPSFTTETLQHFHARGFAATELFFVIGADAFREIESWKDYPALLDRAHFAVVSRPGFPVRELPERLPGLVRRMTSPADAEERGAPLIFLIHAPTADVSASAIRQRSARGESIAGLVPPAVRQHIERHALYSATISGKAPTAGRLHGQD
jgi:nicotinate-nucleotide adenylyltransferase